MDHISIASLPGMYQRTVTIYELSREDFLLNRMENRLGDCTTSSNVGDSTSADLPHVQDVDAHAIRSRCSSRGARVVWTLEEVGFVVFPSSGTYFVVVDHTPLGLVNDVAFCEYLIKEVGVVASVFHLDKEEGKSLVRFALCNDEEKLRSAVERMKLKLNWASSFEKNIEIDNAHVRLRVARAASCDLRLRLRSFTCRATCDLRPATKPATCD
ncbi:hypothetical protein YC2023_080721 [Brassica napus]